MPSGGRGARLGARFADCTILTGVAEGSGDVLHGPTSPCEFCCTAIGRHAATCNLHALARRAINNQGPRVYTRARVV